MKKSKVFLFDERIKLFDFLQFDFVRFILNYSFFTFKDNGNDVLPLPYFIMLYYRKSYTHIYAYNITPKKNLKNNNNKDSKKNSTNVRRYGRIRRASGGINQSFVSVGKLRGSENSLR